MEVFQMNKSKANESLNNDEIASVVVDVATGAITDSFRYGDSYKKQTRENRKKILEFLAKEDECVEINKGVSFVKLYDDVLEELNRHLNGAEFNLAIRLAKHVSFKDCILRTNGNPNGKVLDSNDVSALLVIPYSTVRRLISSLIKKGVLGVHITGCKDDPTKQIKAITCNPFIFTRGNKVNNTIASLFSGSNWNIQKKN